MSTAQDFEEFVAIAECGSLSAAATELGLPRATLSRRLQRLEDRLGVRLVHRTTRRLGLTPPGKALYAKARGVVHTAREAEAEVRRHDGIPRGLLRVAVPTAIPAGLLAGWTAEFCGLYPEVHVEYVAIDGPVDLIGAGFDVALQPAVTDASLIARTLVNTRLVAVASPEYLGSRGTPQRLSDLADHDCILGHRDGVAPERTWPLLAGGSVEVSGTLRANQMGLRLELAKLHLGITLVMESGTDLASGDVVRVLPELVGRLERVALVWPDRTFLEPKVRAFVDLLSARIAETRRQQAVDAD